MQEGDEANRVKCFPISLSSILSVVMNFIDRKTHAHCALDPVSLRVRGPVSYFPKDHLNKH